MKKEMYKSITQTQHTTYFNQLETTKGIYCDHTVIMYAILQIP
jgi:hypothetical protein